MKSTAGLPLISLSIKSVGCEILFKTLIKIVDEAIFSLNPDSGREQFLNADERTEMERPPRSRKKAASILAISGSFYCSPMLSGFSATGRNGTKQSRLCSAGHRLVS